MKAFLVFISISIFSAALPARAATEDVTVDQLTLDEDVLNGINRNRNYQANPNDISMDADQVMEKLKFRLPARNDLAEDSSPSSDS